MITNDNKSYLGYLNELADEKNNTYYHLISKKAINADYSALTKEIETNPKVLKFKIGESGLLSTKTFLAKVTLKISQEKYFLLILCQRLIHVHIKSQI